ncbi:MAG: class I SAM-dependent methyltransferase [Polyangia bacterium]
MLYRYRVRARAAVDAARSRLPDVSSWRVLELGAAEGRTLLHVRELLGGRGSFNGVEISPSLIDTAPELPHDTRLIRGDAGSLPAELEPSSYDLCLALAVLEHLEEPEACVREAARALRPGGVFVATCPDPFWDRVAGKLGLVADEHHALEMGEREMLRAVERAGLVEAEFERFMWLPVGALPYLRAPVPPRLSLLVDRLVRPLPFAGHTFVNQLVSATKP